MITDDEEETTHQRPAVRADPPAAEPRPTAAVMNEAHACQTEMARRDWLGRVARQQENLARDLILDDDEQEEWGPIDEHGIVDGWQLMGRLAEGSHALVFLAARDGRYYAFKWLAPIRTHPSLRARVEREIAVLELLRGVPHIIQLAGSGEAGGRPYLVLELAVGDLEAFAGSGMPPVQLAVLMGQTCLGLAAAHALGIVHRDIKPSNLLLMNDWLVHIGDWGIVRRPRTLDWDLTLTGERLGTTAYMAPEFFGETQHEVGPPSDVFAVGCTAAQLSTGLRPRLRPDGRVTIPSAPGGFAELVAWATNHEPSDRPSAMELALAFGELAKRGG